MTDKGFCFKLYYPTFILMKKILFLITAFCVSGLLVTAQSLTGKWQWVIQGSGQDIQADYLVELDLKQEGSRVYGLRTLFLKNFDDIIIKVEGTVNQKGEVFLDTREVVQCNLPDTILVAKSFSYKLFLRADNSKRMEGIFYPREDVAKKKYRLFDPGFYDAIYATSFSSPFKKLADTLTTKASTFMGIPPPAAPAIKTAPAIVTETQHRITIPAADISIDMYDNGEVDGDSITLLINDKVVLQHQRLSLTPIHFGIKKEELTDSTSIIMRAENLGRIPPNTALMLLTAAGKRYDLRLSSDLKKQAAVVIYRKKE